MGDCLFLEAYWRMRNKTAVKVANIRIFRTNDAHIFEIIQKLSQDAKRNLVLPILVVILAGTLQCSCFLCILRVSKRRRGSESVLVLDLALGGEAGAGGAGDAAERLFLKELLQAVIHRRR